MCVYIYIYIYISREHVRKMRQHVADVREFQASLQNIMISLDILINMSFWKPTVLEGRLEVGMRKDGRA